MMRGRSPQPQPFKDGTDESPSLTPVVVFAASPGTITGVITLSVAHAKLLLPVTVLVAIAVGALGMWIVMVLLSRGGSRARGGLLRDTGTQFMGLIVLAMGVQFVLTGLQDFLVRER
jgi:multiple antibiotic resistance protein